MLCQPCLQPASLPPRRTSSRVRGLRLLIYSCCQAFCSTDLVASLNCSSAAECCRISWTSFLISESHNAECLHIIDLPPDLLQHRLCIFTQLVVCGQMLPNFLDDVMRIAIFLTKLFQCFDLDLLQWCRLYHPSARLNFARLGVLVSTPVTCRVSIFFVVFAIILLP